MVDSDNMFELIPLDWFDGKTHKVVGFRFPTGHIAMSAIPGNSDQYFVSFNYMEEYHEPGSKITESTAKAAVPHFGIIFDNLQSMRAVGKHLLTCAEIFSEHQKNENL